MEMFVHGVLVGEDRQAELAAVRRIVFVDLFNGTELLTVKDVRCIEMQISVVATVQW